MKHVILLLMIKNEEKIIERCIRSALPYVDALCIVDTGSTDNTADIVNGILETLPIPYDCSSDNWENFGHNRTLSFKHAVTFCDQLEWKRSDTYAMLLDADMKWKVGDLAKETLTAEGYTIEQRHGNLRYFNTRLVRLDIPWKCVGVTHEYWDGGKTDQLHPSKTYIEDVGDGGAKADKFQRDIRLLTEGLQEDPTNGRYMFYLAQSYKDTGRFQDAIQMYKKRIRAGGWYEEVWYSHYMIAKCHMLSKNELKMDYWANRAFQQRPSRSEPLYMLIKYYREKGDQWKAFYYWRLASRIPKTTDTLFVEQDAYGLGLDYEFTILHYYVYPNERKEGLRECIRYINDEGSLQGSVYSNTKFYLESVGGKCVPLNLPAHGDYIPSSISCLQTNERLLLNVRYVNYRIQPDGSYKMSLNGKIVDHDKIRTKNAWKWSDDPELHFMDDNTVDAPKNSNQRILGLEDVRLYSKNGQIRFVATSPEYSYCDKYRILDGIYDYETSSYWECKSLRPPVETSCEKNWIPIQDKFVYKWHPLQIGELQEGHLKIVQEHNTPAWFQHLRGSSNPVVRENLYYLIVHGIHPTTPRKYYHQVVVLDDKFALIKYSLPFYFQKLQIEYCLGWYLQGSEATAFVSSNDSDPFTCSFSLDTLSWV